MTNVLFIAAEAAPFAKTGGLGDVVGSLPKALNRAGLDVRVLLPKYGQIAKEYRDRMTHLGERTVPLAWRKQYGGVEKLEYGGIIFYFLDNEYYFKRDGGYYGQYDDAERFGFFCRGALETIPLLGFVPDILHCHDWQSAMVPVFLEAFYRHDPAYRRLRTVFTIHNLKYQGVFSHWILHNVLGLGDEYFTNDRLEYYGQVNFLKGGIVFGGKVTTVSPSYAREICRDYSGEGMAGLLREKEYKLQGILNGLDYEEYNPQTDPHLFVHYTATDAPAGKRENKTRLQQKVGLPVRAEVPLAAMVSRLTTQKGLDLLLHILEELLADDLQVIILGTGEARYEETLSGIAAAYRKKMKVILHFDEGLARQIYAASDLYLMPSLFEPCGLSQLIALRYGSLPVVRETGGLKDTVYPYQEKTGEGNGFTFSNYNAHDFLYTIRRALGYYREQGLWQILAAKAMQNDFSWERSAEHYRDLYNGVKGG